MNPNQAQQTEEHLQASDVANYLRVHPDFFQHELDLLEVIKVPHQSGEAVSLVAKQIEVLRERNRKLQTQLSELVHIARDNDTVFRRLHELTLVLLDARSVDDALASLRWILHEAFQADFVTLRVFEPRLESAVADLCMPQEHPLLDPVRAILEAGVPVCGEPGEDKTRCLFDGSVGEVLSYALIPLRHAGLKGFLAIGSRCSQRFQTGMGNFFLAQLGEIVAARLADLLRGLGSADGA
jgi:uncharacterized protein YigA (DUF484 family)